MQGHASVHSVLMKTLFLHSWGRLAKRNDFVVSSNVKCLNEMIIFIYKQDIQHLEAEKTMRPAGFGLISQAEK